MTSYFIRTLKLVHKASGTELATIIECRLEHSNQVEYLAEMGRAGNMTRYIYSSIQGVINFTARTVRIPGEHIEVAT